MSKKKNKKARKAKIRGRALKAASPAFLTKAYGANVVPLRAVRRVCWNGSHVNKASAKFCATCGTQLAATYGEHAAHVTKAHHAAGYAPSVGASIYDPDPARRDLAWKVLHPETYGKNGKGGVA